MYNERTNFSMKNVIFQFLFVALFIFILIWLFPMKSDLKDALSGVSTESTDVSVLYDRIFNENVIAMKDAAKSYFTTPRLPKNVGDKVKMTLREMLDAKIILPFVDKNGDTCDLDASYVEITKYDEEFVMKVNLKCGEDENYLLVYMGCYDYCTTAICEKNQSDIKTPVLYSATTNKPVVNNTTNNTPSNPEPTPDTPSNPEPTPDTPSNPEPTPDTPSNPEPTPDTPSDPEPEVVPTTPSCSLKVTSGTLSGSNYVGTVVVGFASKDSGANAKLTGFGLGTTTNYNGNTSYKLTNPGTYTVKGYVKNSFGKTATCSKKITIVEEKDPETPKTYEYKYAKTTTTEGYYKESDWSDWSTTAVSASTNTAVKTKTVTTKKLTGYNVTKGPDYSKPIYGTKEIVIGQTTKKVCTKYEYVPTGEYSYSGWTYVDDVYFNNSPKNTDTVKYVYIDDSNWVCGANCTAGTTHKYKKYTRTKTPITTYECTKTKTKTVDVTQTIQVVTGYEQKVISKEPVYETVKTKYYSYKTRQYIKGTTSVDYKWSNSSNDKTLISKGYTYTGEKREK